MLWLRRLFWVSAAILFFSLFFHSSFEFNQDLGRHLLTGKIISETRQVPDTNLFSYTYPDFPFMNMHWLWEVFVYQFSLRFDTAYLIPLQAIIMTGALILVLFTALKHSKSLWATALALVIFTPLLLERTELRPEVFSYLFTAIFVYVVFNPKSKLLYLLPFIVIIWVNTHIYFFLGPALMLLAVRSRKALLIFLLTCLATLVNPNGFWGATYPLRVFENYGYTIVENQPPLFLETLIPYHTILYFKVAVVVLVGSFLLAKRVSRLSLLLLPFLVLPFTAVRSFPFIYLIFLPVLAENLSRNRWAKIISEQWVLIAVITVTLWRSWRLIGGDYYQELNSQKRFGMAVVESGKGAADFIKTNNLSGPVFNNFDIGGYLDYKFFPGIRVFVDNRPGEYPAAFFKDIYIPAQESPEKFAELDKKYNFNLIIFAHTDQTPWAEKFLTDIIKNDRFKLVYLDDYAVIFSKEKLPPVIRPGDPLPLARVAQIFGWTDQSERYLLQAYVKNPKINLKSGLILF